MWLPLVGPSLIGFLKPLKISQKANDYPIVKHGGVSGINKNSRALLLAGIISTQHRNIDHLVLINILRIIIHGSDGENGGRCNNLTTAAYKFFLNMEFVMKLRFLFP